MLDEHGSLLDEPFLQYQWENGRSYLGTLKAGTIARLAVRYAGRGWPCHGRRHAFTEWIVARFHKVAHSAYPRKSIRTTDYTENAD